MVVVSDGLHLVSLPVTIEITGVDETPPVVTAGTVTISEKADIGASVLQVQATDIDLSPHNIQSYTFTSKFWCSNHYNSVYHLFSTLCDLYCLH